MSATQRAPHSASGHMPPFPVATPAQPTRPQTGSSTVQRTPARFAAVGVYGTPRPQTRYDPRVVLAARAASARGNSPLRFQRQVSRHRSPLRGSSEEQAAAASDAPAHVALPDADPILQMQHEHLEAAWQPPTTYSAMYNRARHKSKQALFSNTQPIVRPAAQARRTQRVRGQALIVVRLFFCCSQFHTPPTEPATQHVAGLPMSLEAREPSFRTFSATPLQAYLEAQWCAPDLLASIRNLDYTRGHRHYFDSPTRGEQKMSEPEIERLLMLHEGQAERAAVERFNSNRGSGSKTERRREKKARRAAQLQSLSDRAAHPQLLTTLDGHLPLAPIPASLRSRTLSPDRVLSAGYASRPPSSLVLAEALDPGALVLRPPPPSFAHHPHNRFFRFIPKSDPAVIIKDLRRERDWNGRHQLQHSVDGW